MNDQNNFYLCQEKANKIRSSLLVLAENDNKVSK